MWRGSDECKHKLDEQFIIYSVPPLMIGRRLIVGDEFLSLRSLNRNYAFSEVAHNRLLISLDGSLFLTPLWTLGYRVKVDIEKLNAFMLAQDLG